MRISDWSSDVCSSDLLDGARRRLRSGRQVLPAHLEPTLMQAGGVDPVGDTRILQRDYIGIATVRALPRLRLVEARCAQQGFWPQRPRIGDPKTGIVGTAIGGGDYQCIVVDELELAIGDIASRSEENKSEPQSLITNSYAGLHLKKNKIIQ